MRGGACVYVDAPPYGVAAEGFFRRLLIAVAILPSIAAIIFRHASLAFFLPLFFDVATVTSLPRHASRYALRRRRLSALFFAAI